MIQPKFWMKIWKSLFFQIILLLADYNLPSQTFFKQNNLMKVICAPNSKPSAQSCQHKANRVYHDTY